MNTRNRRTLITNIIKTVIAYLATTVLGYILYYLVLYKSNVNFPAGASYRTCLFSIVIFAFFVFVSVKIYNLPVKDEKSLYEKDELKKLQVESDYNIDYKAYFKNQIKTRLWGAIIALVVIQLPLIINYAMISYAEGYTVFSSPVPLYKFYMPSLFVWEILGPVWFLAPILFPIVYAVCFWLSLYRSQKSFIPGRPEWMKKNDK